MTSKKKTNLSPSAALAAAKEDMVELIGRGLTVAAALEKVGRSRSWYESNRSKDPDWRRAIDQARLPSRAAKDRAEASKGEVSDFVTFRSKYLNSQTFPHQRAWIDVLEGREPKIERGWRYEPARPNRLLINTPPNHCAVVSTPVLTANRGWVTVGDVGEDDWLFGQDGVPAQVAETWEPSSTVPVFTVKFNTGDEVTTDAGHLWHVRRTPSDTVREMSTEQIMRDLRSPNGQLKWRVDVAPPLAADDADLPLDPYILGYWLGDGDSNGYRIATSVEDIGDLVAQIELAGLSCKVSDQRGGHSVYVYGMTAKLRQLGLLNNKHVPSMYATASHKQRLALLQGLMDSDGTITAKDGRAKFVQVAHRERLAWDVYHLAASLGYQPRMRTERGRQTTPQGRTYNAEVRVVAFKPEEEPVFRLHRKACKQKTTNKNRRTLRRTIVSVEPAGEDRVRCISTFCSGNVFLIGDGLIPTRNAKSMTVSIDYVVYRICMNPNVRVMLVSKTQQMAKKFLYAVKQRLTHPMYRDLQLAYGPEGGFKEEADQWTAQAIYLGGEGKDSGEKDPTVEAIGLGGQIYGARADLIICDDAVTLSNAHQWADQMDWLRQEVASRLGPAGKLLVIGTRVAAQDLYRELRNPEHYSDKHTPWTYLGQPALLDSSSDNPEEWTTLWPRSDRAFEGSEDEPDADGLYPRWTGPRLKEVRNDMGPTKWALVYQQEDVNSDMIFDPACVQGSVDGRRQQGPITRERMQMWAPGRKDIHPEGFYRICSMDPAMSGDTAAVAYAVDRRTRKRYVLDVNVMTGPTPAKIRELIQEWTEVYAPHEWVVESNAFQLFLTQDEEIQHYLANKGIPMVSHYTGRNKTDPEFGVASLAPLFGSAERDDLGHRIHKGDNLISLPSTSHCAGSRMLCDQLVVWDPNVSPKHRKQDTIMALWFAELRARRVLNQTREQQQHFYSSPFTPQRDVDRQAVVSLDQWAAGNQPTMSFM